MLPSRAAIAALMLMLDAHDIVVYGCGLRYGQFLFGAIQRFVANA